MGYEFGWRVIPTSNGAQPIQRRYFTSLFYNGLVFFFGGLQPSKVPTNDFSIFDPKTGAYGPGSRQGAFPPERAGHSAVIYNGKMYIFGGIAGKVSLNDFFAYDFEKQTWEQILPSEGDVWPSPREYHSAVVYNDSFYLFGGSNGIKKYKNDLFRFNFATRKFTQVNFAGGVVPEARAGHIAFIRGNELFIYGGYCGDGGFTYLGDTLALPLDGDDSTRSWRPVTTQGLAAATARPNTHAIHKGRLYVFGGYAGDQPTAILRFLELETLEWKFGELWMIANEISLSNVSSANSSSKATKPFARYGHGTVIDDEGTIYVFFGTGSTYLTDIVEISEI